jgi:hypothetical protein
MSVIINGTDGVTFNDASLQGAAASPFGLKNRIINGDMRIDQRNAGASVTVTGYGYSVDRWQTESSVSTKYTIQQNAGAVATPAGFSHYLGVTSSSAYSVGAGETFALHQYIEGFNTADLGWGTANAQTVTLSFWVRSSLTGTFGGSLKNGASDRSYPFSYTVSSANTWEKKTITITGDTTGTWIGATNGIGVNLTFGLGVGSTYSGTAGAWSAGNYNSATGATSVVGTSGATFYITGVQLEQNTSATPFERRLYNQELANCQRYFQKLGTDIGNSIIFSGNVTNANAYYTSKSLAVVMRASPTITVGTQWGINGFAGAPTISWASSDGFRSDNTANSTTTGAYYLYAWTASAEL